jgi:hypothetical protein
MRDWRGLCRLTLQECLSIPVPGGLPTFGCPLSCCAEPGKLSVYQVIALVGMTGRNALLQVVMTADSVAPRLLPYFCEGDWCVHCAAVCRSWCVHQRHGHHGLLQVQDWVQRRRLLSVRTPVPPQGLHLCFLARCPGLLQRWGEEWERGGRGLWRKLRCPLLSEGTRAHWHGRSLAEGAGFSRGHGRGWIAVLSGPMPLAALLSSQASEPP